MEKSKEPEILYSAPLRRIEKYSADLKEVNSRLKKARLEIKEQKKYLDDLDSDKTELTEEKTLAKSRTREVLEERIKELGAEIDYFEEEGIRLAALIAHEAAEDQLMQTEMDNTPAGKT
jgi:hypothetical protein